MLSCLDSYTGYNKHLENFATRLCLHSMYCKDTDTGCRMLPCGHPISPRLEEALEMHAGRLRPRTGAVAPHFSFAVPRSFRVRIPDALVFYGGIMLHWKTGNGSKRARRLQEV